MKKLMFLISMVFFVSLSNSFGQHKSPPDSQGIQFFDGSWDEALALAKKENKPIFLDVFTSWCGPCKLLKKNTFPDSEVGKYFNENFINVTLDAEKGDGIQVAREFKVQAYPSLFILRANGEPLVYYPGFLRPDELIELGKTGIENTTKNN